MNGRRPQMPTAPSPAMLWGFLVLVSLVMASVAILGVRDPDRSPQPPFLKQPPIAARAVPFDPAPPAGPIRIAGSGSNLPLTRALAEAFAAPATEEPIVVHDSIGSTGGIRATLDGVVDIGLISRPLRPGERTRDLRVVPYARVAVVVAASPGVPDLELTIERLLDIYRGTVTTWGDGSPIRVLQREAGDSSHGAVEKILPRFRAVNEEAYRRRQWRVLYHDRAMQEALLTTHGAVGLFDRGAIVAQGLPLRVLRLDGVEPNEGNVLSGAYPYVKDLAFVVSGGLRESASRFLDFVASAEGRRLIKDLGYIPLHGGEST